MICFHAIKILGLAGSSNVPWFKHVALCCSPSLKVTNKLFKVCKKKYLHSFRSAMKLHIGPQKIQPTRCDPKILKTPSWPLCKRGFRSCTHFVLDPHLQPLIWGPWQFFLSRNDFFSVRWIEGVLIWQASFLLYKQTSFGALYWIPLTHYFFITKTKNPKTSTSSRLWWGSWTKVVPELKSQVHNGRNDVLGFHGSHR